MVTAGTAAFDHLETGNGTLGFTSVVSVIWDGIDVSGCFALSAVVDGIGTIRSRELNEIAPPLQPTFTNMWTTGGVVVVTIHSTGFGADTFHLHLGAHPAFGFTGATYDAGGSLTADSHGNDFAGAP